MISMINSFKLKKKKIKLNCLKLHPYYNNYHRIWHSGKLTQCN